MNLKEFFKEYKEVAIAFSGGVDSAFLLQQALKYKAKVRAYYVESDFQPQFEKEDALKLVKELDADIKILKVDILSSEDIYSNSSNRCYFCKRKIFKTIIREALKDGFKILLDGTNASDSASDRPGMKALEELKVISPLRLCNLTKDEIRILSKKEGLFTWNKPAYACLATRIPTNTRITKENLKRTEKAEEFLSGLGFSDFRVRYLNGGAKIQVKENDINKILENRKDIVEELSKEYSTVLLDLEVR